MFTGIIFNIFKYFIKNHELILFTDSVFIKLVKIGDSVAVNGVCLTVSSIDQEDITFHLTDETISKTTFKFYNEGLANVELAVKYGDHLGGHLVLGHVHETGTVISLSKSGNLWISLNVNNVKYKDSVAINGVSLTVAEVSENKIRIALIPETIKRVIPFLQDNYVNIEYYISSPHNEDYMRLAIQEGERGRVFAPPNPWVGCIIVKNDRIIGKGYHEKCGSFHAEINAINNAQNSGEDVEGATMYVTLEPCCYFPGKRTRPCVDQIIKHKISKVIIGVKDPNPRVSSVDILKEANIIVEYQEDLNIEIYNEVCYSLRHYIHYLKTGLPYITLKIALSANGCYVNNKEKWITHEESRKMGHYLRSISNAVIVGAKTIVDDDPELTVRYELPYNKDTYRKVVMDGASIKHKNYKIFSENTIICTQRKDFYKGYSTIDKQDLKDVVKGVGGMHILVEGGNKLHRSFCESGLVQEIVIFRSQKMIEGLHWNIPGLSTTLKNVQILEHEGEKNIMETYLVNNHTLEEIKFDNVELAVEEFKNGGMVVVMDDENRENEGDIIVAANLMTESQMVEMINMTSGIICTPMEISHAKRLNLNLMCDINTDTNNTAFTVSVDSINTGTGVSAKDRLATIHAVSNLNTSPNDLRRPGHIFPLISKSGLDERRGHTEAGVTLCKLSEIYPRVAVIGELQNKDGTMMRRDDCYRYARNNKLPIITINDLAKIETGIKKLSECELYTKYSDKPWKFICFDSGNKDFPHRILIYNIEEITNLRIHSDCFTGDVLSSVHCDCGDQLDKSMRYIVENNNGVIIFPAYHEGRGIGIVDKVKAYKLQKEGYNTFEANHELGHSYDARSYEMVNDILNYLNIDKVELLTENPDKISALGSKVLINKPIIIERELKYLKDKREYFKKLINSKNMSKITPELEIIKTERNHKVGIVYSTWHSPHITKIREILKNYLNEYGIKNISEYEAPGSNEIPFIASKISKNVDGIICVGILIKGDTLHFENVSTAVSNGIMQAQLQTGIPMMNVILSCFNFEQVEERIGGEKSTLEYIVRGLIKVMEL